MIDKDEAIRLLRKNVANKGEDYIYKTNRTVSCVYFRGEEPACIVGHVFADSGYSAIDMTGENEQTVNYIFGRKLSKIKMTHEALQVLSVAQFYQDEVGTTWGYALESAEEKYRELGGTE